MHLHPRRRTIATSISLFCLAAAPLDSNGAYAASRDSYTKCVEGTSNNGVWAECGSREISRQETRLNAAWKKAQSCFDVKDDASKRARDALLNEQRLWIKWKDNACSLFEDIGYAGREGQVLSYPGCKIKVIKDRADWLTDFAKDGTCR